MCTQTHTKVWWESFCSDNKVTLLQLVQNPSTRWRSSRFCSLCWCKFQDFHSGVIQDSSLLRFSFAADFKVVACVTVRSRLEKHTYTHTYISLLKRCDTLWMNRNITNVNLWHHWALTTCGVSHNGITDTNSILMKERTIHGLQINSCKRRLKHFTALKE